MKFTMADDIKIQVGDILQLVPMKEWEELKVEFADKEQQRRLAGNKVRVIEVNAEDEKHNIAEFTDRLDVTLYTLQDI